MKFKLVYIFSNFAYSLIEFFYYILIIFILRLLPPDQVRGRNDIGGLQVYNKSGYISKFCGKVSEVFGPLIHGLFIGSAISAWSRVGIECHSDSICAPLFAQFIWINSIV